MTLSLASKNKNNKTSNASTSVAVVTTSKANHSAPFASISENRSDFSSVFTSKFTEIFNQNLEDLTVIWLDANINNTEDCRDTKARLRSSINYLVTFDVLDQCTDYIKSVTNETIFLVVSGSFGETTVGRIHNLPQVAYIYVFCGYKAKHELWARSYAKICGVYDDKASFFSKLMTDVKMYSQNSLPVSFLKNDMREKSVRALTDEKVKFIWYQWLMEILIRMPQSLGGKIDMLNESRAYYNGQAEELSYIQEFEDDYGKTDKPSNAIWWYTRECFLYRLLNKALRTENIDIIFKYRFFLKDLYKKLCELHANSSSDIRIVYRGQAMSMEEIKTISANINGLISFNTFVSTSQNKAGAIWFAQQATKGRPNVEPVLFEITLLSSTTVGATSQPYANIAEWSYFKTEEEVLLSLGTVCCVTAVNKPTAGTSFLWHVKLTMKDKDNEQLKMLKQYIGLETREQSTIGDFGILFLKLGDLIRAKHYFAMMIKQTATNDSQNISDRCELHNNMGLVYAQKGDPKTSLTYYQTALQLHTKAQTTGQALKLLPMIYRNIGYSYLLLKDWNASIRMFEKALHHLAKLDHPDEELRGTIYLNMATVTLSLGDTKKASEYCEKASTSWHKCLPDDHTNFSQLYRVQGQVTHALEQYQTAIEYQNKVLTLHKKTLPSDHIQIAETYADFATIYSKMDSHSVQALEYYNKALDIYLKALPSNHPTICHTYIKLGELHQKTNENDAALENYKKASCLSRDATQGDLHVVSLVKIVKIYLIKEKKDLAFYYALEAIEIALRTMSTNSPDRPILRQILPLFRTIGQQPTAKRSTMYKMAEKLIASSPVREIILNPIFSTCTSDENISNMSAVEKLEVQDQKTLDALFKEDSIQWNEIIYK